MVWSDGNLAMHAYFLADQPNTQSSKLQKKKDTIVHALTFQAVEQRCQLSRTPRALAVRPSSR
jgi:hypothetical protein